MKALAPGLLIAMPQMTDPNFEHTVVLMIEHGPDGSMGLVINRRTELSFAELAESQQLSVAKHREADTIFSGGPVEPYRGFVLHDAAGVGERVELAPGLFLSITSDSLEPLLTHASATLRFCLGYAGWGPGQIEKELTEGAWLFTEADKDRVLTVDPKDVWADTIRGMGLEPGMLVTTGGIN